MMNEQTTDKQNEEQDDKYGMSRPYDGYEGCWPGDGSGMDDFADYNAMEGGDY